MADRYAALPAATTTPWNNTATWKATTLGATGASIPTSSDNVFVDVNSVAGADAILTISATANCLNMDWTGATNTPTLAGTVAISIYGSRTYIAAMIISYTGAVTYKPAVATTAVLTGNTAVGLSSITINGAGTVQLADKFTLAGTANLTLTAGTFNANGQEVSLNGTAHTIGGVGAWTFATLTRNGTATKTDSVTFTSGTTVTCTTFAMIGNSATNRLLVQSSVLGTAATITATNWTGTANVDIMDITATNAVDLSAGSIGDCGGNTGVTCTVTAAQTFAYGGVNYKWSTAGNWTSRVPLPQDDVTCLTTGITVTVDMPRTGKSITFTGTGTVTGSIENNVFGSYAVGPGVTHTYTAGWVIRFCGRGSYSIVGNFGASSLYVRAPTGTYTIGNNRTNTTTWTIQYGTLVTAGYSVSSNIWTLSGTATLDISGSTVTSSYTAAGTHWNAAATATLISTNSTIVLSNSSTTGVTFAGGGLTYNNVIVQGAGAYALTITGNNTFNTFNVDASAAAKTIVATGTTQTVTTMSIPAAGTTVVTITGGTWKIRGYRNMVADYLSVSGVTATYGKFYALTHSTNGGGNTRVVFGVPPADNAGALIALGVL